MVKGLYHIFEHWNKYDNIYLISDPHFGENGWPVYDEIDSDERVAIINKYVHKKDCLICLGDVGDVEYIKKLKAGYKVLITGNHDKGAENYKHKVIYKSVKIDDDFVLMPFVEKYFDEIYTGPVVISDKIILSHEPIDLPFMLSIHGHDHSDYTKIGINLCGNLTQFVPVRLKDICESGILKQIEDIHRVAIDKQREREGKEVVSVESPI